MEFHKNKKSVWKIAIGTFLVGSFAIFLSAPISNSVRYLLGDKPAVVETQDGFFDQQRVADGFRKYQNLLFRFTLQIPEKLTLREYSEGNTTTLVFEDKDSGLGFQIFVVPHEGIEVGDERFKMDIPSGVVEGPTDIMIDSVRGTIFFSKNTLLGETREVWFINDGFLFEVTARRELDLWLSEIMRTWKFLQFS